MKFETSLGVSVTTKTEPGRSRPWFLITGLTGLVSDDEILLDEDEASAVLSGLQRALDYERKIV